MAVIDSGFQVLPGHKHTVATGDGGTLDFTTLYLSTNLQNILSMWGRDSS